MDPISLLAIATLGAAFAAEEVSFSGPTPLSELKPNSRVTIYHGTQLRFVKRLINGFDANLVAHRHYTSNGNRHAGLFVSPDPSVANRFAGGTGSAVLQIEVEARNLHGTNYGGTIGRHQRADPETLEWIRSQYPESFRPYLSMTLLQRTEPQALLRGLVSPGQIKHVYFQGEWHTRDAFLRMKPEVHVPHGSNEKIFDTGYDMSTTKRTLEGFFEAFSAGMGEKVGRKSSDEIVSTLVEMAKRLPEPRRTRYLLDLFERAGFGQTASQVFLKKLLLFIDKNEITTERGLDALRERLLPFCALDECYLHAEELADSDIGREYGLVYVTGAYFYQGSWRDHAWNVLPDGTVVDVTHGQFDPLFPILISGPAEDVTQRYLQTEKMSDAQLLSIYGPP